MIAAFGTQRRAKRVQHRILKQPEREGRETITMLYLYTFILFKKKTPKYIYIYIYAIEMCWRKVGWVLQSTTHGAGFAVVAPVWLESIQGHAKKQNKRESI